MVVCEKCKEEIEYCRMCGKEVPVARRNKAVVNWEIMNNKGYMTRETNVLTLCRWCCDGLMSRLKEKADIVKPKKRAVQSISAKTKKSLR
jgi:alkylated DNA repair dioxygenase AlkB